MANLLCTDTELTTVADAIRSKGNTSAQLGFPTGMANAIAALNVGTGLSPAATAADIRNGKKAVVNRQTLTGSMTEKAAATYNTSTSDQTIAANQYLTGAQTIRKVTTANISAGNIKAGVTVKVGDTADDDRIAGVAGTFTSDGTAAAGHILSGKTAYVNGSKVTGTISSKAAATYNVSSSDQTIASGQYLSGAQTIRKVTTANLSAGNIKAGVTVKVGDAGDDDRIAGVTGTFTSDADATSSHILSGKTAYVNGSKVTGGINSISAATHTVSSNNREIDAGLYIGGKQTFLGVKTSNISAGNIKSGVTIKVGDQQDDDRLVGVTGTYIGLDRVKRVTVNVNSQSAIYSSDKYKEFTITINKSDYSLPAAMSMEYFGTRYAYAYIDSSSANPTDALDVRVVSATSQSDGKLKIVYRVYLVVSLSVVTWEKVSIQFVNYNES